jgi:hypothetical protein
VIWAARVLALLLVASIGWLFWEQAGERERADGRPIWFEPGEYKGPPVADEVTAAEVEAIAERAQRLDY